MFNMTKKEKVLNIFKTYLPYFIIFVAALLSCFIYFLPGLAGGDDIPFHISMTNDVLYGWEHGYFGYSTNHLFMGGFAFYNYAFYGPVTHYGAAIFVKLFGWAGATPFEGLKFMVIASATLGGTYMYRLTYKMSKGNILVSLVTAVLFVFLPYRIFCALARCAYAESIAMALIPMVFYGAYSFLHDKKWHVEPYVVFAAGAILIVLSHAFTGLVTATFGFIYILFNAKGVFNNRKNYRALISFGSALVIIVFCVLFYVLNSLHYESSNLYNLSNAERQWTTYAHISQETSRTYDFSGFINIIYVSRSQGSDMWPMKDSVSMLLFTSVLYFIAMIIAVTVDFLLKKVKYNKWYRHGCATIAAYILPLIFQVRPEIYLAIFISLVIYFFITFISKQLPVSNENEEGTPLYKNVDLYFIGVSIIICLALLFVPEAWKLVPSIYYQGQFAWRMWSITAFLVAMLVGLLLSYYQTKKIALIATSIIACGLMTLTMGTLEKRVVYEMKPDTIMRSSGYDYAMSVHFSGAQNEMAPQVFYESGYKSEYSNSLYSKVRNSLYTQKNYIYSIEQYFKPEFLKGAGDATITEYNSPNNKFHIEVYSDTALVQFPQIYYDTYGIYADGKSVGQLKNVDGLVAFEMKQGIYDAQIVFKPAKGYLIGRPLFYIGLVSLVSGGVFGYIYRTKIMKEKDPEEQN